MGNRRLRLEGKLCIVIVKVTDSYRYLHLPGLDKADEMFIRSVIGPLRVRREKTGGELTHPFVIYDAVTADAFS